MCFLLAYAEESLLFLHNFSSFLFWSSLLKNTASGKKKTGNGDFIADRPKGTQNAPQLSGVQDYGRNLDES